MPVQVWFSVGAYCFQEQLYNVSWIIYMDSDTLVLSSLTELWNIQTKMNSSQAIGAAYADFRPTLFNDSHPLPHVKPWGRYLKIS